MKKILAILLCFCEPSWAAVAVRVSNGGTASPLTITSTTSGDLIVVNVGQACTTGTVTSITDGGDTFTQVAGARKCGTINCVDMWYAANVGSGHTSMTINTATCGVDSVEAVQISGAATSSPLDTAVAGTTGVSANPLGPTITNANSGSILVTGEENSGVGATAVSAGWAVQPTGTFPNGGGMATQIPGDTTGHAATWTAGSASWTCDGASFLPAAAASTATCGGPFCGILGSN